MMKGYKLASRLCALLCCLALVAPSGVTPRSAAAPALPQNSLAQDAARALNRYDVVRMDAATVQQQVRQTARLTLRTSEGTFDLTLTPNDMRAENYRAVAVGDDGVERELPRDAVRTYKGTVAGMDGAQARLTVDEQTVEGMILTPAGKFFVEPAARYSAAAAPDEYLFYSEADVIALNPLECAVPTLAGRVDAEAERARASLQAALVPVSPMREAEIATDADFEYFQAFGSEAAAKNEILSIMNQVDGVYQREIGLTFKVIYQRVWTTPNDPYDATTLSGLLEQVRVQWRDAQPAGSENRDLVHMWTGRDLDGTGTGLAYSNANGVNGVVCRFKELAVGVSERVTIAPQKYIVPAHEIGHNFSAQHPEQVGHPECALTIMSGVAQGNTAFTFCQFSRDEITTYINNNNSCLAVATAPAGTVQFSQTDYRAGENAGHITVTVTRSNGNGASTVQYETVNQTANDRSDYTTALGRLNFASGETTKTFDVFITDDVWGVNTRPSSDPTSETALETFQVVLLNATNASVGTPSSANVTIADNDGVNGSNPVKDPSFSPTFFVRQHYVDFFNREPDQSGLSFWSNQTTSCGSSDVLVCRINVSAAFFLSGEFQETGFYVIRVYRVAYGTRSDDAARRITYRPFIRDARQVGEGFVGGAPGAEQVLENNKNAFALQVANETTFNARFPQTTADSLVDALFASAGVAPTGTERQSAINAYNAAGGGTAGRAAALRSVSDSNSVRNAEFRGAFVLMEYFGYMRRDPDQAGYSFWLGKLNEFGGNYIAAEMVKSFIISGEYQQRFGP